MIRYNVNLINSGINKKKKENINKYRNISITNNLKLQYISDIHLEYRDKLPKFKKVGNCIALLGDIGDPFKSNYSEFIKYTSNEWDKTFILSGNHEYWQQKYDINDVDLKITEITTKFNNVFYLNNSYYDLENYRILGTTLWSHVDKPPIKIMGDDIKIKNDNQNLTYKKINKLHFNSKSWLSNNISNSNKPLIVLTHHLPSYNLIIDKYQNSKYNEYFNRFASNMDDYIKPPVKFWLCGHSHCNYETIINNVYCGINAFGYPKQSEKHNSENISKFIILN